MLRWLLHPLDGYLATSERFFNRQRVGYLKRRHSIACALSASLFEAGIALRGSTPKQHDGRRDLSLSARFNAYGGAEGI